MHIGHFYLEFCTHYNRILSNVIAFFRNSRMKRMYMNIYSAIYMALSEFFGIFLFLYCILFQLNV